MLLPGTSRQIFDRAFLPLKQAMLERDFEFEPLEILIQKVKELVVYLLNWRPSVCASKVSKNYQIYFLVDFL